MQSEGFVASDLKDSSFIIVGVTPTFTLARFHVSFELSFQLLFPMKGKGMWHVCLGIISISLLDS